MLLALDDVLPLFVSEYEIAACMGVSLRELGWMVADGTLPNPRRLWWHSPVEDWLQQQRLGTRELAAPIYLPSDVSMNLDSKEVLLPLFVSEQQLAAHLGVSLRDLAWMVADGTLPNPKRLWWHADIEGLLLGQRPDTKEDSAKSEDTK